MKKFTETNAEVIAKWKNFEPVWTAELGGIGPGYEQAIQDILWSIFATWDGPNYAGEELKNFPEAYEKFVDEVVTNLDKEYGFSGSQVGAARHTAFQFIRYGYAEMMNKLDDDRKIMITRPKLLIVCPLVERD